MHTSPTEIQVAYFGRFIGMPQKSREAAIGAGAINGALVG